MPTGISGWWCVCGCAQQRRVFSILPAAHDEIRRLGAVAIRYVAAMESGPAQAAQVRQERAVVT